MPERPRILYNLALFENSQGNVIAAEEYLLKALKKEPENYDFLYAVCAFYLEHRQNSKVAGYARQLVAIYPDNPVGNQLLQAAMQ